MKGITPVIAIILLLLITISMVGFAFLWFTEFAELAASGTEATAQQLIDIQQKTVRIDNVVDTGSGVDITIRSTGASSIDGSELATFIGGSLVTCSWSPDPIMPSDVSTCTASGSCPAGTEVKVSAPGNSDIVTCD